MIRATRKRLSIVRRESIKQILMSKLTPIENSNKDDPYRKLNICRCASCVKRERKGIEAACKGRELSVL